MSTMTGKGIPENVLTEERYKHAITSSARSSESDLERQEDERTGGDKSPAEIVLNGPPDGGLTAWLQVVAGNFICIISWGLITSYGVFQSYYSTYLTPTPSESDISWIGTMQIFCLLFIGAFAGRASDAGYARLAVLLGTLLIVFGLFMASLATKYYQLLLSQGICVGLGMGVLYMPGLAVFSSYFKKKKSFAVAITSSGAGIGGIIYPVMAQQLLPRIGFGWTIRCIAMVTGVFAIAINCLLKPRVPPRKSGPIVDWGAFTELPYVFFCIGFFLVYWSAYFAFYYIDSYGYAFTKFSQTDSINLLLITNALGIPGRILPGFIASMWLGPLNTAVPTATIVAIIIFSWLSVGHSESGLWAFAAVYGFFASSIQALFAVSLAALTEDLSQIGVRMGMVFTVVAFAALTGSPVAGALIKTNHGSYLAAQIWAGVGMLLGAVCLGVARISSTGFVLRVKK